MYPAPGNRPFTTNTYYEKLSPILYVLLAFLSCKPSVWSSFPHRMGKTLAITDAAAKRFVHKQVDRNALTRAIMTQHLLPNETSFFTILDDAQGDYLGQEGGGIRLLPTATANWAAVTHAFARLPNGNTRTVESKVDA